MPDREPVWHPVFRWYDLFGKAVLFWSADQSCGWTSIEDLADRLEYEWRVRKRILAVLRDGADERPA